MMQSQVIRYCLINNKISAHKLERTLDLLIAERMLYRWSNANVWTYH